MLLIAPRCRIVTGRRPIGIVREQEPSMRDGSLFVVRIVLQGLVTRGQPPD